MAKTIISDTLLHVTRRAAMASGATHYFTGKPCKYGHIAVRSVARRHCPVCVEAYYKSEEQLRRARVRYKAGGRAAIERAKSWGKANPEKWRLAIQSWYKRHPEKGVEYANRRRALKAQNGGDHTADQVSNLCIVQRSKCAECKRSIKAGFEVDHIVPLSKGGANDIKNIQLLCRSCNRRKAYKHPIIWAQENGRLL